MCNIVLLLYCRQGRKMLMKFNMQLLVGTGKKTEQDEMLEVTFDLTGAEHLQDIDLALTHPIRLGLALNFSVFYSKILNSLDVLATLPSRLAKLLHSCLVIRFSLGFYSYSLLFIFLFATMEMMVLGTGSALVLSFYRHWFMVKGAVFYFFIIKFFDAISRPKYGQDF